MSISAYIETFLTAYGIFTLFCSDSTVGAQFKLQADTKCRPISVDRLVKITGNSDTVVGLMDWRACCVRFRWEHVFPQKLAQREQWACGQTCAPSNKLLVLLAHTHTHTQPLLACSPTSADLVCVYFCSCVQPQCLYLPHSPPHNIYCVERPPDPVLCIDRTGVKTGGVCVWLRSWLGLCELFQ